MNVKSYQRAWWLVEGNVVETVCGFKEHRLAQKLVASKNSVEITINVCGVSRNFAISADSFHAQRVALAQNETRTRREREPRGVGFIPVAQSPVPCLCASVSQTVWAVEGWAVLGPRAALTQRAVHKQDVLTFHVYEWTSYMPR